jgi:hypothetical protein
MKRAGRAENRKYSRMLALSILPSTLARTMSGSKMRSLSWCTRCAIWCANIAKRALSRDGTRFAGFARRACSGRACSKPESVL